MVFLEFTGNCSVWTKHDTRCSPIRQGRHVCPHSLTWDMRGVYTHVPFAGSGAASGCCPVRTGVYLQNITSRIFWKMAQLEKVLAVQSWCLSFIPRTHWRVFLWPLDVLDVSSQASTSYTSPRPNGQREGWGYQVWTLIVAVTRHSFQGNARESYL